MPTYALGVVASLRVAMLLACLLVGLSACGGGDDSEELEQLRAEVEALKQQLDTSLTQSPTPTSTSASRPAAIPAPSVSARPTPSPTTLPVSPPLVRYIGNTGGSGISFRSDCAQSARVDGGWAESAQVTVGQLGTGRCEGWSVARVGETSSWVNDSYLVEVRPTQPARAPAASPTPGGASSTMVVSKSADINAGLEVQAGFMVPYCVRFAYTALTGVVEETCTDIFVAYSPADYNALPDALIEQWDFYRVCWVSVTREEPLPSCWEGVLSR